MMPVLAILFAVWIVSIFYLLGSFFSYVTLPSGPTLSARETNKKMLCEWNCLSRTAQLQIIYSGQKSRL